VPSRRSKKRLTLRRFWASLKLPFFEIGGEWKRKPVKKRRGPSRKAIEAKIRSQIRLEQEASETPVEQMLREIEQESARRFQRALRQGEPAEIGAYGVIRKVAGDELRRRKQNPPQ
jgi:hypothetical protein